jgi:hypothetical protein
MADMFDVTSKRGSIWHCWDPHIHTPGTALQFNVNFDQLKQAWSKTRYEVAVGSGVGVCGFQGAAWSRLNGG